jgi:phosphoserine phosphatase
LQEQIVSEKILTDPQPDKPLQVLVVDLDGTLIHSDMLYETFWSASAATWITPFAASAALLRGRAALKERLAALGPVDVATLPYNETVLDYVRRCRDAGMMTALVTASDQRLADRIAAHLGIFDVVHGSGDGVNLKGVHKARFLATRFPDGFHYVGDSVADLKVWGGAAKAVTVTPSRALRARVERLGPPVEHLEARQRRPTDYLRALGLREGLLNLLVLVPLVLSMGAPFTGAVVIAFFAFVLVTSGLAVARPFLRRQSRADIPISHATMLALFLIPAGLLLSLFAGVGVALLLAAFVLLYLAVDRGRRRYPMFIAVIGGGLRLIAGALAAGVF